MANTDNPYGLQAYKLKGENRVFIVESGTIPGMTQKQREITDPQAFLQEYPNLPEASGIELSRMSGGTAGGNISTNNFQNTFVPRYQEALKTQQGIATRRVGAPPSNYEDLSGWYENLSSAVGGIGGYSAEQSNFLQLSTQNAQQQVNQNTDPTGDERATALAEAEKYYGYVLPTGDTTPFGYNEMLAELQKGVDFNTTASQEDLVFQTETITGQQQDLLVEYQNYLEDLQSGELRAGEDRQISLERDLVLKNEYLNKWSANARAISAQRSAMAADYRTQLESIKLGRTHAGETNQLFLANTTAQKQLYLDRWTFEFKKGVDNVQKTWIQKGGLWSGVRREQVDQFMEGAEMAKTQYVTNVEQDVSGANLAYKQALERFDIQEKGAKASFGARGAALGAQSASAQASKQAYLSGFEFQQEQKTLAYDRQMEDYLKTKGRAEQALALGTEDITQRQARAEQLTGRGQESAALDEIQRKRSLQEYFQEAVGLRTAQSLEEKYTL